MITVYYKMISPNINASDGQWTDNNYDNTVNIGLLTLA